ncbi:efflux RND transporter periplasmic adaptor subunit [Salmonella enterica subsp. enterica]|nr:efflux RND transporter periplasmic adaptor subunit [Salmonella enterica subsp. enterica]
MWYAGRRYSETAFYPGIQTRFTIKAPIDSVITAFDLRTGARYFEDKVVAQIQGMDPVWISAAVPIYRLSAERYVAVEISVPAYPDKIPCRKMEYSSQRGSTTLQVRLEVSNKDEFQAGHECLSETEYRSGRCC